MTYPKLHAIIISPNYTLKYLEYQLCRVCEHFLGVPSELFKIFKRDKPQ